MAAKCNILTHVLKIVKETFYKIFCIKSSDTDEAIMENYAEYLDCPDVDINICHPSPCTNPPIITLCEDFSIEEIALVKEGDVYIFSVGTYIGGNPPFSCVWEYDADILELQELSNCTLKLKFKDDNNILISSLIKVTITDDSGCIAEKTCYFVDGDIFCDTDYILCPADTSLSVVTYAPDEANLIFTWNKVLGEPVNLAGRINGTFYQIDWGDGTINTSLSHTYSLAGSYTVRVYNSTATIILLGNKLGVSLFNITDVAAIPNTVEILHLCKNLLTAGPNMTALPNLKIFWIFDNAITGTIDFGVNTLLEEAIITNNQFTGGLDLSGLSVLQLLEADTNQFTSVLGLDQAVNLSFFQIGTNNLDTTAVDYIFVTLDTNGLSNGLVLTIGQLPPATLSMTGLAAKSNLVGKGWAVLHD